MDYNVVRQHADNAFRYYKNDDNKYKESMSKLYSEGKSNPSVTKIILDNTVTGNIGKLSRISSEVMEDAKIPDILPSPEHFAQRAEFEARANIALMSIKKGLDASEIPNDKGIDELPEKVEFDKKFNELYPKTAKTREHIIDAHRISMDRVTPKDTWSNKIMYAKTNAEYKKLYPKSFMTRVALVVENQIKDNEVTKRVSGFFNRSSYKAFVNKSFSFLKQAKK